MKLIQTLCRLFSAPATLMMLLVPVLAEAHGYITLSRAYKCTAEAGNLNSNCGAVQWEPQSLEGPDRYPEGGPADGTLAAAGKDNFSELNEQSPTRWHKTVVSAGPIAFTWHLTAPHSTRDWRYFITKPDWNPNLPLSRSSFEATPFCEFNDDGAIPPRDFTHDCTLPGNRSGYHVVLAVWDVADTANSFYHVIDLDYGGNGNETGNQPPSARISGVTSGYVNESLTFSASTSQDPDGQIVSYTWDFGDGTTSSALSPSHVYANVGTYTVRLTVTDDGGLDDTATTSVQIRANLPSVSDIVLSHSFEGGQSTQPPVNNNSQIIAGYFTNWGVYSRDYHVKNIVTSGSAERLTHIIYAFGNVQNGQCTVGDAYADYEKAYPAELSVDGIADQWDDPLKGNFNQLLKLKARYPHIKILWSFGGWTWSGGFSQAANDLDRFADSCYNLVHDPRWDGLFDGIDIDWEYPNECGLSCDNSGYDAYRLMMQALRNRFGNELITSAIGAGETKINAADYAGAAQYLDHIFVMTYDFFGAWVRNGPTAPHSPLYDYPGIPQAGFYADNGIQVLLSKGVPAKKLTLGIGFYGRGWAGVSQLAPGGSATGPAPGTYEAGIEDYKVLKDTCPATEQIAGTAYGLCGDQWWSYDTPETIAGKMNYVRTQNLGGAFFWELSGDTSDGELIRAMNP